MDNHVNKNYNVGSLGNTTIKSGFTGWRDIGSNVHINRNSSYTVPTNLHAEIEEVNLNGVLQEEENLDLEQTDLDEEIIKYNEHLSDIKEKWEKEKPWLNSQGGIFGLLNLYGLKYDFYSDVYKWLKKEGGYTEEDPEDHSYKYHKVLKKNIDSSLWKTKAEVSKEEWFGNDNVKFNQSKITISDKSGNYKNNTIWKSWYGSEFGAAKDNIGMLILRFTHHIRDAEDRDIVTGWANEKRENTILKIEDKMKRSKALGGLYYQGNRLVNRINDHVKRKAGLLEVDGETETPQGLYQYYDDKYRVASDWQYGNVTLWSTAVKAEWNALQVKGALEAEGKYGKASISGEIDLIHAEASASAQLTPNGFKANASAEFSLLHATGNAHAEAFNGLIGTDASATVDVGHVYAQGMLAAGWGENGPELGVQGKIGADLVTATASGSINVAGIGVTGNVAFKVGVGAQADIGYKDGVLKFHLGAAIGIGFEFGFSLDVSGVVDAVKQGWEHIENVAVTTANAIADAAKDVGNWVGNAAQDVGNWIGDAASAVGDWFASW